MRLRKVCPQCNTVVHVKRSCCGCGHVFTLKRKVQVSADKGSTGVTDPTRHYKRKPHIYNRSILLRCAIRPRNHYTISVRLIEKTKEGKSSGCL